jgi:hypothetical protein
VRVGAVLRHQHLGAEVGEQLGDYGVQGAQPGLVRRAGRQGDVDRAAGRRLAAGLLGPAGAGEEEPRVLVEGDGEDAGVVPERRLDAVAVVDVGVEVGHTLGAELQQAGDGERGVVVDAEAGGVGRHGVVQAAGEVDGVPDAAVPDVLGTGDGLTGDQGGDLVHAREGRSVLGAQAAALVGVPRLRGGVAHGLDVVAVVHEPEHGLPGRLGGGDVEPLVEAERLHQAHGERQPHGIHRMTGAEVVAGDPVVPHQPSFSIHE